MPFRLNVMAINSTGIQFTVTVKVQGNVIFRKHVVGRVFFSFSFLFQTIAESDKNKRETEQVSLHSLALV